MTTMTRGQLIEAYGSGRRDFRGADLRGVRLTGVDLSGADLRVVRLTGVDLSGADLSGADLRGADLCYAALRGADLNGADLRHANLTEANLSNADLACADLTGADLTCADLRGADLRDAELARDNLTERANLTGANLEGAHFSHFIEQDYLDQIDYAVVDDLMEEFRRRGLDPDLLGLTREDLRQRLIQARARASLEPREILPVTQRRRQELRRRLDERSRALANRILQALGVAVPGRDIATLYPEHRSVNNFGAVIQLVHSAVNLALGIERRTRGELPIERIEAVLDEQLPIERIEAVLDELDTIGNLVELGIRERLQRREES